MSWKNKIYNLYKNIEKNKGSIDFNYLGINQSGSTSSSIRRLGKININKVPAFPRMHNKFIICFNDDEPYNFISSNYKKIYYTSPYPEMLFKIKHRESFLHPNLNNNISTVSLKYDEKINDRYIYYEDITYMDVEEIKEKKELKEIQEIPLGTNKLDGILLTGSYNYTENSNNSLENVICIKDQEIIKEYFEQFCQLSTISVELDWDSEWKPHRYRGESDMRYGS